MSGWFAEQRLEWIRETVEIFGFINREHIMRKFRVTVAVASSDLQKAQHKWPSLMTYNLSAKRYESTNGNPRTDG